MATFMGSNWKKTTVDIRIKSNKNSSPVIKITQFPFMLAWACTVHKVHGWNLSNIVVSLPLLTKPSRLMYFWKLYWNKN